MSLKNHFLAPSGASPTTSGIMLSVLPAPILCESSPTIFSNTTKTMLQRQVHTDLPQHVIQKYLQAKKEFDRVYTSLNCVQKWVWLHRNDQKLLGVIVKVFVWVFQTLQSSIHALDPLNVHKLYYQYRAQKIAKSMKGPQWRHLQELEDSFVQLPIPWQNAIRNLDIDGRHIKILPPPLQLEKILALHAIEQTASALNFMDPSLQDDPDVVQAAVQKNGLALEHASLKLRRSKPIVSTALIQNPQALNFAICTSTASTDSKDEISHEWVNAIRLVAKDGIVSFITLSPSCRDDRTIAIVAIKKHNYELEYGHVIQHAGCTLQADKDLILMAVEKDGVAIQYAHVTLRGDREIAHAAVRQNGRSLKFLSPALQQDKEIVLAAIKTTPRALQFASPDLRNDREVVLSAVKANAGTLQFASQDLKNDNSFILVAVQHHGSCIQYAGDLPRHDKNIALAAVLQNGAALAYLIDEFKNNPEIVMAAVKNHGKALQYASLELKKNKRIVMAAASNNVEALKYADDELLRDNDVLCAAYKLSL